MTNEEAVDVLMDLWRSERSDKYTEAEIRQALNMGMDALKREQRWIPVKWHEITEEEREKEGYSSEWLVYLDCILPEDGEEILITTKHGYVEKDTAYYDDECYLDSGYDWVDDVVAWMPLPEPYKAESEDKLDGDPVDIDKAVEHYEGTLETLKDIDLEVQDEAD